jgi:Zn-dependent peptidase ImmA (M78 family)
MCCSEDGCISYNQDSNKYIILFNDDVSIARTRIRFTLCHEYGHYLLMHLLKTKNGNLSCSNSITEFEHDKFEKEANLFARELLVPSFLVSSVDSVDLSFISEYFYVSEQVSEYLIKYINKCKDKGWTNQLMIPNHLRGYFTRIKTEFDRHRVIYRSGEFEKIF